MTREIAENILITLNKWSIIDQEEYAIQLLNKIQDSFIETFKEYKSFKHLAVIYNKEKGFCLELAHHKDIPNYYFEVDLMLNFIRIKLKRNP